MIGAAFLTLFLAPLSTTTVEPGSAPCRIAILTPESHGLTEKDAHIPAIVVESLAGEVSRLSSCETITDADIASMLAFEGKKQQLGCDADAPSCLSELGDALGVEEIVASSITRIDQRLAIAVRRIDVVNVRIAARTQVFAEPTAESLRAKSQEAVRALFLGAVVVDDEPDSGLLGTVLFGGGLTAVIVGGVVATAGLASGGGAYAVTKDPTGDGELRALTNVAWAPLLVVGAGGAVVLLFGAGALGTSFFF